MCTEFTSRVGFVGCKATSELIGSSFSLYWTSRSRNKTNSPSLHYRTGQGVGFKCWRLQYLFGCCLHAGGLRVVVVDASQVQLLTWQGGYALL